MFDIAFSELIVIVVVALVVIGPEKLPKVARTLGHLLGRAQRYIQSVKSEMNSELNLDALKKLQDEIRLNTLDTGVTEFQVGQVINHDMPQNTPVKYQIGQVIHHEVQANSTAVTEPLPDISHPPEPEKASQGS